MIELLQLLSLAKDAETQEQITTQLKAHATLIQMLFTDIGRIVGFQAGTAFIVLILAGVVCWQHVVFSRKIKALEGRNN
jgi:hypothetical protein